MRSNHCFLAGVVALMAGGCVLRAGGGGDAEVDAAADAAADAAETPDGAPARVPFGPATVIGPLFDPVAFDDDPSLTDDERELFFDSDRAGGAGQGDVFVASRDNPADPLGMPAPVVELGSPDDDTGFKVSGDGLTIVFSSDRPGGLGGRDIWIATRPSRAEPWTAPVPITEINSATAENGPTIDDGGKRILFASDRDGDHDLYIATRQTILDPFGPPVAIDELSSPGIEDGPWLTDGARTIYFYSDRDGDEDIYFATRELVTDPFGEVHALDEVNSPLPDADPWVSQDEHRLVFSSSVSGNTEIYEASR